MIRSAVRLPIPGTAWKRAASPAAIAAVGRARAAAQHRQRHLRSDTLDPDQHQEEVALGLGGKAVELDRVVAHDQVREQAALAPGPRDRGQRLVDTASR